MYTNGTYVDGREKKTDMMVGDYCYGCRKGEIMTRTGGGGRNM